MFVTHDMHYGDDYKKLPVTSTTSGEGIEVRPDVYMFTDQIVNVVFIGNPRSKEFVIVDTGMPKRAEEIIEAAYEHFGEGARAQAIILTHGHFDHVGSVIELIEEWDAPVYAHPEEFPYLTGSASYLGPDPSVEGGLVAKMSIIFPTDPIMLDDHLQPLPEDGSVPYLPDFRWLHVPGHSIGQIALYRPQDGLLLSADAFVTTRQEDLYQVITQNVEISGPPRYLTTDWEAAKESVVKLQQLDPQYVISGHGRPVEGAELKEGLDRLVAEWDEVALPDHGKFVDEEDQE
jgi:glyoxylase-like metal-dependent hydrolase (beta-lactamase superfamily II)